MHDQNKGKWKLSAKEIVGNVAKMTQMQTLIAEEVGIKYGLERGIQDSRKHGRSHQDSADHNYEEKQKAIKVADEQLATKQAQNDGLDETQFSTWYKKWIQWTYPIVSNDKGQRPPRAGRKTWNRYKQASPY